MSRNTQEICIFDYDGPQGSKELTRVESSTINRSKSKSRLDTMNRRRESVGFQSGTQEVSITLTIIPQLIDPEVDWERAWLNEEIFNLAMEKGLEGRRELAINCEIESVNDTHNAAGEARQEVTIQATLTRPEG